MSSCQLLECRSDPDRRSHCRARASVAVPHIGGGAPHLGSAADDSGEAGVGKSALVGAFCAGLPPATPVHRGFCDSLDTPWAPGPLHDIARSCPPALGRQPAAGGDRHTLFTAFLDAIATGGSVTAIEDAHWADAATLDLLLFVGRRVATLAATVVVTYRAEAAGGEHALRRVLGDLATVRSVQRLAAALEQARWSEAGAVATEVVGRHADTARAGSSPLRCRAGCGPGAARSARPRPAAGRRRCRARGRRRRRWPAGCAGVGCAVCRGGRGAPPWTIRRSSPSVRSTSWTCWPTACATPNGLPVDRITEVSVLDPYFYH